MVEKITPEICLFCKNWKPDKLSLSEEAVKQVIELEGSRGNIQTGVYGKCRARYIDQDGEEQVYDKGTFGASVCSAIDDKGNKLYEKVDG